MHRYLHLPLFLVISWLTFTANCADDRPNVVLILADDLGWGELSCFGQQRFTTPNIDRLAAEGIRLTQHYSGAPVCAPSRCVLMTGKHLGRAEIRGNLQAQKTFPQFTEGQHPITDSAYTIAEAFKKANYSTGAMGKWGLGPVGSSGDPNRQGFDLFYGYNCQAVAHSFYAQFVWRNQERIEVNPQPIPGHQKKIEGNVRLEDYLGQTYVPHKMVDEAIAFLRQHAKQPFFLYLPLIEPHMAMHPPKKTVDEFPADWDDRVHRGEAGYLPHPRPRAGYAAMIRELDNHVGRVLQALDELQLTEKTLVIFSSDNGATHEVKGTEFHVGGADPKFFNSTAGLRGYKGSVYEGGIRVPTLARFPGKIKAGSQSDAPSYFADWFPTLAHVANLEGPAEPDGENLWPILTGQQTPATRKPMIWVFPEYGGQVAVRLGNFKVVRQGLNAKKSDWEVYNLGHDISEGTNLASQHPEVIQQALAVLRSNLEDNPRFPLKIPGVNDS